MPQPHTHPGVHQLPHRGETSCPPHSPKGSTCQHQAFEVQPAHQYVDTLTLLAQDVGSCGNTCQSARAVHSRFTVIKGASHPRHKSMLLDLQLGVPVRGKDELCHFQSEVEFSGPHTTHNTTEPQVVRSPLSHPGLPGMGKKKG